MMLLPTKISYAWVEYSKYGHYISESSIWSSIEHY